MEVKEEKKKISAWLREIEKKCGKEHLNTKIKSDT